MDRILLIATSKAKVEPMKLVFEREGFAVRVAPYGVLPATLVGPEIPSMVVLTTSSKSAEEAKETALCMALRADAKTRHLPILVLAEGGGEPAALRAFDAGADDFVEAPWLGRVIIARVRAILRRTRPELKIHIPGTPQRIGPLTIDAERHQAFLKGDPLPFTLTEYRLLAALATRPGHVFSRDRLLEAIAGGESDVTDRNVDAHVKMIRKKLGEHREMIQTVRGIGYKCRDR